ncbi:hypothetical protein QAD02_020039 [Eretmocerus hayati]|uniref:Uncharacterized protein n=1 Tax=Eretmocerus hayati TaxID=131215 RepID=A0ACC2PLI0_9HYME|nr:hypothetical protein QAD02_020039 [Eretmocerus hayati]
MKTNQLIKVAVLVTAVLRHHALAESQPLTSIVNVASSAESVLWAAQFLWEAVMTSRIFNRHSSSDTLSFPFNVTSTGEAVLQQLRELSEKQRDLKLDLDISKDRDIEKLIADAPGLQDLSHSLRKIYLNTLKISYIYDDFLEYVEARKKTYDKHLLRSFAEGVVLENSCGVKNTLVEISGLLIGDEVNHNFKNVFDLFRDHSELYLQYIRASKSPQQFLHNFLHSIIDTEMKGYLVMRFSYTILDIYGSGDYAGHMAKAERDFTRRMKSILDVFRVNMNSPKLSREYLQSDPSQQIQDQTYTQLQYVFQRYLINEVDINPSDKCHNYCDDYKSVRGLQHSCYGNNTYCTEQRACEGNLWNCQYANGNQFSVCPSDRNLSRRYEYIIDEHNNKFGLNHEDCGKNLVGIKAHMLLKPFSLSLCDVCACLCAETSDRSERYFSLDPNFSRHHDNYVVTGVRFLKQDRITHIQIQEGQLLPNGFINESTVSWVPVNSKPANVYTLTWDVSRGINLDDLEAPFDHVLIGVSLSPRDLISGSTRLHLKIFSKPVNASSGMIDNDALVDEFIADSSTDEVKVGGLEIPTYTTAKSNRKSQPNQYLKFGTTGFKYDAGQSTIPFIDIQNVTTSPPAPLSGVGIYHRNRQDTGGYLALKIFTFNFAYLLNDRMSNY